MILDVPSNPVVLTLIVTNLHGVVVNEISIIFPSFLPLMIFNYYHKNIPEKTFPQRECMFSTLAQK